MRTIKFTRRFQRNYKREKAGRHGKTPDAVLPHRRFDHPLSGAWNDFRDCHLKPDLILIYRKPDAASRSCLSLA
jgi:mRNA interferase YafQ